MRSRASSRALGVPRGQARERAAHPDVLLFDEPFAALDEASRPVVRDLLRAQVSDGRRPVVLVTHDPADARALADRVVPMTSGHPAP